jgi:hypothetical protein
MPPQSKRRRPVSDPRLPDTSIANFYVKAQEVEEDEEEQPTQRTQRGRPRAPVSDDDSEEEAEDGDETNVDATEDSQDQAVKKLVRYALACEFQRMVIRRTGIAEKGWFKTIPGI